MDGLDELSRPPGHRVVVSGGTGFLGRRLAAALRDQGRTVVVLTRRAAVGDPLEGITYARVDLERSEDMGAPRPELAGVETFFHLASDVAWTTELSAVGLRSLRTQVEHPLLLLEAMGPSLQQVVFASSMMVYPLVAASPLREERDERPENFYGAHKLVFERAGALWARRTGRRFVSARIGQAYGAGMRVNRFLPDAVAKARRGEPIVVFGDGSPTADWLHVADVVAALLRCETARGGAFNVGSGAGTSNLEMARAVVRALGSRSVVELAPERSVAPRHQILDIGRARERLGWEPSVGLEEGLRRMAVAGDG